MNTSFRQMQIFHTIAVEGSFTKASELLHLSQPAVSIQYKAFAEQFHFPLLQQRNKRYELTEFGQSIFDHVEHILRQVNVLETLNENAVGELAGSLHISSVSTGKYILPYLLSAFLDDHPKVRLVMDVTNKSRVVQALKDNTTDLAFVSVLPTDVDTKSEPLMENTLLLVAHPSYWATHKNLPFAENTFVYRESGSATRKAMETYFKECGIEPQKKIELLSNEAVKQSLMAGMGMSILPYIGIHKELEHGDLVVVPKWGLPITTQWHLCWRMHAPLSPVASAYLDYVRKHKESITRKYISNVPLTS